MGGEVETQSKQRQNGLKTPDLRHGASAGFADERGAYLADICSLDSVIYIPIS